MRSAPERVQRGVAAAADAIHRVRGRMGLVVVLVVVLGDAERRRRLDACEEALELMRVFERAIRRLGAQARRMVAIEDDRTVLASRIAELTAPIARVGVVP